MIFSKYFFKVLSVLSKPSNTVCTVIVGYVFCESNALCNVFIILFSSGLRMVALTCANTGILARWWCDKKPIYFLSNIHVAERDGLAIIRHNKEGEAIMVNVIIGTETWLNSTINSNEIIKSALRFNVYRKDRPNKSYDCSNKRFD